jgi:hypothetical protein
MIHLDIWNTSYGQKKGRKSNWQIDSWSLKIGNHLNLLAGRWHATYFWKAFNESYNFASYLISIGGVHVVKVVKVSIVGISSFSTWESPNKWHLRASPMANHKIYYKGEGGGFPQVQAVVSFVNSSLPMVRPNIKNAITMRELICCLVCVGLCDWLIACHFS